MILLRIIQAIHLINTTPKLRLSSDMIVPKKGLVQQCTVKFIYFYKEISTRAHSQFHIISIERCNSEIAQVQFCDIKYKFSQFTFI